MSIQPSFKESVLEILDKQLKERGVDDFTLEFDVDNFITVGLHDAAFTRWWYNNRDKQKQITKIVNAVVAMCNQG